MLNMIPGLGGGLGSIGMPLAIIGVASVIFITMNHNAKVAANERARANMTEAVLTENIETQAKLDSVAAESARRLAESELEKSELDAKIQNLERVNNANTKADRSPLSCGDITRMLPDIRSCLQGGDGSLPKAG